MNFQATKVKSSFYFIFILFLFLMFAVKPIHSVDKKLDLSQDSYQIQIINVENEITLNANSSSLWIETITIIILENYSEAKTINIIYQETIFIESVSINDTLSPSRVINYQGKSEIEIIPIIEIKENDIVEIILKGVLSSDLDKIGDNLLIVKYNWGLNYVIPNMKLTIILPEFSNIAGSKDLLEVYPRGYTFSSNGKSIILTWDDLVLTEPSGTNTIIIELIIPEGSEEKDNNDKLFLHSFSFIFGILTILGFLIFVIVIYIKTTKLSFKEFIKNLKTIHQRPELDDTSTPTKVRTRRIPVIVKPQQNRILSIIQENGGIINQNDLVKFSGLSKARISQYLKELSELDLISREKQGRENLIYLKTDLGNQ